MEFASAYEMRIKICICIRNVNRINMSKQKMLTVFTKTAYKKMFKKSILHIDIFPLRIYTYFSNHCYRWDITNKRDMFCLF